MSVRWHGPDVNRRIREGLLQNLERAAITLKNEVRRVLSRPGRTGKVTRAGRQAKIKNRSVSRRYGLTGRLLGFTVRSRPGEPPRKQTGDLRRRIAHEMDKPSMLARVGTNLKYARYLERGVRGGKIIRPRSKKGLANQQTGQFFGKQVRQGAISPRPFLRPTLERLRSQLQNIVGRTIF